MGCGSLRIFSDQKRAKSLALGIPLYSLSPVVILAPADAESPMRSLKWIEWNLGKIDAHGLSAAEVEAAFDRVFSLRERKDGSFEMFAATRRAAESG
jgi:hypothetical protein